LGRRSKDRARGRNRHAADKPTDRQDDNDRLTDEHHGFNRYEERDADDDETKAVR